MQRISDLLTQICIRHAKAVVFLMVAITIAAMAAFPGITIDVDPENMLRPDEPVRLFHNKAKADFQLSDIIVLGVVHPTDPDGAFNPGTLQRIHELTEFARTLQWQDPDHPDRMLGVVEVDMIAPSMVDHIRQDGPGAIRFEWLMSKPPATRKEALLIRDKALSDPLLNGRMVSEDGKVISVYLPLTSKEESYRIYTALQEKIAVLNGPETYHITGIPMAEGAIGVEMFTQMAVASPLAMATILGLLFFFFRKWELILSPMIIATVSVITTMGLLIACGFTVHIMSSMIPTFLMTIAVVDSIHILSEFFDTYTREKGRRETIREVMTPLFRPMLYTSLTSAAGFASLVLSPNPPVRVFGLFVGAGIMIAWIFTICFIPAYITLIPEKRFADFGFSSRENTNKGMARFLHGTGGLTLRHAKPILLLLVVILSVSGWGISQIQINDNPVKWFAKSHPIRKADIALNTHFGGTHPAYLILESRSQPEKEITEIKKRLLLFADAMKNPFPLAARAAKSQAFLLTSDKKEPLTYAERIEKIRGVWHQDPKLKDSQDLEELHLWCDLEIQRAKPFKRPELLRYMAGLQDHLENEGLVGKASSVSDAISKVHQELMDGTPAQFRVPDSALAVAECYLQLQQSHRPDDLWHMVTPDYEKANLMVQLSSGDNKTMEAVMDAVDRYFRNQPPPVPLSRHWAGLTYINVVWQDQMVWGMLESFMGSFAVVFIMMAVLFRSPLWGLLCMVPLTITIAVIYGVIGLIGKDYDMPVAVLGVLTLGMAVDFAIHFLERSKAAYASTGSWASTARAMFGEPARAITRNALVIAIGFLPLLSAPLVPYKTTGLLLFSIMALSAIITLLVLPAILKTAERFFFPKNAGVATDPKSLTHNPEGGASL